MYYGESGHLPAFRYPYIDKTLIFRPVHLNLIFFSSILGNKCGIQISNTEPEDTGHWKLSAGVKNGDSTTVSGN